MALSFGERVDGARGYTELFRLVKRGVERELRLSRTGLMLALGSLGLSSGGFLGGYFVLGSNAIVLNRDVLTYVRAKRPEHHNAYAFHVLLHEYLHTLGYLREDEVRPLAYEVSRNLLGEGHPATRIARAMLPGQSAGAEVEFFRELVFPPFGWVPATQTPLEIVKGFDPDATPYIA